MEEKYRELLAHHRVAFASSVEVERLYSVLQNENVLTVDDIEEIDKQPSGRDRADKLIDIIQLKENYGFKKLCKALENTYPHLLTVMFLGRRGSGVPTCSSASGIVLYTCICQIVTFAYLYCVASEAAGGGGGGSSWEYALRIPSVS